jgi:hypothetical protein
MQRTEVNVETGEVRIIQYTPEEEAEALAYAASIQEPIPVKPTLEELQAQLAAISAQMQSLVTG